jgi:tRNA-binding EMAP/Myf-like protein
MIPYADGAQVTCAPSHPIVVSGAVVGCIVEVQDHPNADHLWLAVVDIGDRKLRIVFGGQYRCQPGDLVPVAPPGARLSTGQRMRTRRYRGQSSQGMLCSSNELGWTTTGPDEVHVLHDLHPGCPLHTGGTACPSSTG